jgi:chromosome segregation ATPase
LVVRIPAPSQDNVIRALQAKVQRLERDLGKELDKTEDLHRLVDEVQRLGGALRVEEERTQSLVEAKEKYKGMVKRLGEMHTAATERIDVLEAAVGEGEAVQLDLQKKLEAQARDGAELGDLGPAVEEYLREKADFVEWKTTGFRRMELAKELARVEDDRNRYRAHVLELERERKDYEQSQKEKLEGLEKELRAVDEYGGAVQARVLELAQDSAGKSFFFHSLLATAN